MNLWRRDPAGGSALVEDSEVREASKQEENIKQKRGMRRKRKGSDSENRPRLVHAAPDIAHPDEEEKYEKQMAFVTAWFLEMCDRIKGNDKKATRYAQSELRTLFLTLLSQLLSLALDNRDEWAGNLLASTGESIRNHDKKLSKANAKYSEIKKKLSGKSLTAALFPKGSVQWIVQDELRKAERYRKTLLLLKDGCISEREQKRRISIKQKLPPSVEFDLGKTWKQAASAKQIPSEYWPSTQLPDFSLKSESLWWDFLWPLIAKRIDVAKLDSHYQMARKRYPSDSENTARLHLKLLARLKDEGTY